MKRGISGSRVAIARLDPIDPRIFWQTGDVTDDVGPSFTAVARDLKVAVVRADPDQSFLLRRFTDGINRGVHFRRRIVHCDAAGLLLLLLLRIVRGQIWRNPFPVLAVIA